MKMNKLELKNKYKEEKVFVVPFESTKNVNDGFTSKKHTKEIWKAFDSIGKYIYRYDAESNPSFQQIIPYIIITNKDGNKIYTTNRIAGDSRLVNKMSIGIGGHINEEDGYIETIFKCAVRELFEEVDIETSSPFTFIGYVRDMISETNDHLGVVLVIKAESNVKVKETDKLEGDWKTIDELILNYNKLENWSKYIVDHFVKNNYCLY